MARVCVADRGPGVPEREQGKIWEPYYRLERDAAETRGGSGIGLAVVRDLVQQHGGAVSVRNRPGGGAEFTVTVPLHRPADARDDDETGVAALHGAREGA
jgi:signal transduction histidine kinase